MQESSKRLLFGICALGAGALAILSFQNCEKKSESQSSYSVDLKQTDKSLGSRQSLTSGGDGYGFEGKLYAINPTKCGTEGKIVESLLIPRNGSWVQVVDNCRAIPERIIESSSVQAALLNPSLSTVDGKVYEQITTQPKFVDLGDSYVFTYCFGQTSEKFGSRRAEGVVRVVKDNSAEGFHYMMDFKKSNGPDSPVDHVNRFAYLFTHVNNRPDVLLNFRVKPTFRETQDSSLFSFARMDLFILSELLNNRNGQFFFTMEDGKYASFPISCTFLNDLPSVK